MLKNGVIEPSTSPYIFNIVIVGKKDRAGEGMDQMCINYAPLNEVTEKDSRPIPIIKKYLALFHGVKMGHADFASRMDTFLPKDSTSASTSTLRAQKQPELLPPKRRIILTITPFNLINNKKHKSNPIAPSRKVEIIRRKKTHNGHYC